MTKKKRQRKAQLHQPLSQIVTRYMMEAEPMRYGIVLPTGGDEESGQAVWSCRPCVR